MQVDEKFNSFYAKLRELEKPWWSPRPPRTYMILSGDETGRFNLYWALNDRPRVISSSDFNASVWFSIGRLCNEKALGGTVGEAACLFQPAEFYARVFEPWQGKADILIATKHRWRECLSA